MKKRKKKLMTVLLLTGVLAATLMGCGKKKEILLWHPLGGLDGQYFEEMVEAYNATDPEYPIKSIVQGDMYTKIYTMMGSGSKEEIPDLMVYHAERIEVFKNQGFLSPMDSVIANQPDINGSNYQEEAWKAGEVDGERWAVPLDTHSTLLIYNEDLVEKYAPGVLDDGIVTFDELYQVKENLTDDSIVVYGMNMRSWLAKSLITQLGGSINDGDMPTINTPEAVQAYTQLKALVDDGVAQPDGEDPLALVQTGGCIFYQGATWDAGALNEIEGLNWGFATTPVFDTSSLANCSSSHQFGMLKKERSEEVQKGIADFLEFVRTNPELWAKSGQNPASKQFVESGVYKNYKQSVLMDDPRLSESITIYDFLYTNETGSALDTVTDDMIFGRLDIEEGLALAQKEVEDKVNEATN